MGSVCAGVDKQPQLWHNPWAGLYVVAVCFFLGLFWVNLLQGAIIDNYCRLIEEMGTGALVSTGCHAMLRCAVACCAMLCCPMSTAYALIRCEAAQDRMNAPLSTGQDCST